MWKVITISIVFIFLLIASYIFRDNMQYMIAVALMQWANNIQQHVMGAKQ